MYDIELKKDVQKAVAIISDNSKCSNCIYKEHSVIPIKGTENVKELFQKVDNSFQDCLMVTGSGDQILEAILHGAKNITSFDINRLAPYGLELKWAAIQALSYEEFLSFYQNKFPIYFYNKIVMF